jgi:hypothetical protein
MIASCSGNKSAQETPAMDTTAVDVPDHSAEQRAMQAKIYGAWFDANSYNQNSGTDAIYITKMSEVSEDQVEELSTSGIHVSGYRIGKFNGTMKSLLYGEYNPCYGLVPSVINYVSGGMDGNMDDFAGFEQLSGIKPFSSPSDETPPVFKQVNPAFIDWAAANLIPSPDGSLYNYTYQKLYDSIFSPFFHKLVLTQIYLDRVYDKKVLVDRYHKQISEASNECLSWLSSELGNLNVIDQTGQDPFTGYGQHVFLGFWLRRAMDGSEESLKKALATVMMSYDKVWYINAMNSYTYNLASRFPGVLIDGIEDPAVPLKEGTFYQVHVEKVNTFEQPSLESIPKEYVWEKTLVLVEEVRKVDEHDMTLTWAKTTINGKERWILGNYLYDSIQNLSDYKSLVIEGGFDTTVTPMRARFVLRNGGKRPMDIPEALLQYTYKFQNSVGSGTVLSTERQKLAPGTTVVLIDDNVVMNGYNQSQIWYAPESRKASTLFYYENRKGALTINYGLMFNNSPGFMSQSATAMLNLPLAERLVDTKQYESWLKKK